MNTGVTLSNSSAGGTSSVSYDIGGSAAVDADRIQFISASSGYYATLALTAIKTGLTAVALTSKYKVNAGTGTFERRWMSVTPVRLG